MSFADAFDGRVKKCGPMSSIATGIPRKSDFFAVEE